MNEQPYQTTESIATYPTVENRWARPLAVFSGTVVLNLMLATAFLIASRFVPIGLYSWHQLPVYIIVVVSISLLIRISYLWIIRSDQEDDLFSIAFRSSLLALGFVCFLFLTLEMIYETCFGITTEIQTFLMRALGPRSRSYWPSYFAIALVGQSSWLIKKSNWLFMVAIVSLALSCYFLSFTISILVDVAR